MTKNNDEKYPNIGGEGQEEQVKRQEIASLETEGSVELKFPTEQRAERGNEIMSGFGWSPFDIGEMVGEKDIWNQYRAEKYYPKSVGNSIRSKVHEFRTKILSQFIAEEFEIQQLSSNNERNDDLRFANVISSIMRSGDHQDQYSNSNWRSEFGGWRDDVKSKRDKNIAVLLKNLVGRYGTVDGTPLFLALAASSDPDSSYRPIDRADQNFLPKHLGTINYIRAVDAGLNIYLEEVMGRMKGVSNSSSFDGSADIIINHRNSEKLGVAIPRNKEEAIVPLKADKAMIEEMQAEYNSNLVKIKEWEKTTVELEKNELLENQIPLIKAKIEELQARLEVTTAAYKIIRQEAEGVYNIRNLEDAQAFKTKVEEAIRNGEQKVQSVYESREQMKEKHDKLGMLSFLQKRNLKEQISLHDQHIENIERQIRNDGNERERDRLIEVIKAYEEIERNNSLEKVEGKVSSYQLDDAVKRLAYLNSRLDELKLYSEPA